MLQILRESECKQLDRKKLDFQISTLIKVFYPLFKKNIEALSKTLPYLISSMI